QSAALMLAAWMSTITSPSAGTGSGSSPYSSTSAAPYFRKKLAFMPGILFRIGRVKIDIFNHVMPMPYLELVKAHSKEIGMVKRMSNLRMLWDIEHRVAMLREKFPDVQQVLTLGLPSPELLGDSSRSPEYARVANDGMAEMCRKYPKEFPAFVASVPMNNPKAALEEMDRAINHLGAKGIQIITSVAGKPLDAPEYFPVFERMAKHHDRPIWMHPARPASRADYPGEPKSQYEIWQVLGWPFETSVAMARMVFSGLLEK